MNLGFLGAILAQATNVTAATTAPAMQDDQRAAIFKNILLVGVMCVAIYLVMFRPQNKRTKELETMLKAVKPGDKVVTSSGIVGTVVAVKDKTLSLRSAETKLEVLKSSVTEITEPGGESSTTP